MLSHYVIAPTYFLGNYDNDIEIIRQGANGGKIEGTMKHYVITKLSK